MKMYIGDSVYAEYIEHEIVDGITLTTENGNGPTNTIFLEGIVFDNLILFVNELRIQNGAEPIIIPKVK